jgi:hypothetical protein
VSGTRAAPGSPSDLSSNPEFDTFCTPKLVTALALLAGVIGARAED